MKESDENGEENEFQPLCHTIRIVIVVQILYIFSG